MQLVIRRCFAMLTLNPGLNDYLHQPFSCKNPVFISTVSFFAIAICFVLILLAYESGQCQTMKQLIAQPECDREEWIRKACNGMKLFYRTPRKETHAEPEAVRVEEM
jgi:hypothetical protein